MTILFKAYFSKFTLIFKICKDVLEGYLIAEGLKRYHEDDLKNCISKFDIFISISRRACFHDIMNCQSILYQVLEDPDR
jgi:hypothetical protein